MNASERARIIEKGITSFKNISKYLDVRTFNLKNENLESVAKKTPQVFGIIQRNFTDEFEVKHLKVIELCNTFNSLQEKDKWLFSWEYFQKIQNIYLENYTIKNKRVASK